MKHKVSVIIPVYNMAEYLRETVDSVLGTDYQPLEVIIVDDGSTDGSGQVAEEMSRTDKRIRLIRQPNQGVCRARNAGITAATGLYILPVDADNKISSHFVPEAVQVLDANPHVKVVCPTAEFFGDKEGAWRLPDFSLPLLARRNMMDTCAMFRRSDWERIGGYDESIIAREDWAFWISMLKDGGEVVRLPRVGLWYRVRRQSKRIADRKLHKHVIKVLNERHPEFFERHLNGPLHASSRTWSRLINRITHFFGYRKVRVAKGYESMYPHVAALSRSFEVCSDLVFKNRNAIKRFVINGEAYIVKSYQLPHRFNRFVYRFFRSTKAERSFRYADMLRRAGIGSPEPIGFCVTGSWFFVGNSYYMCRESALTHDYRDLLAPDFPRADEVLTAIAQCTARMHEHGWLHKDYSGGNILWDFTPEGIAIEIIDLNRIRLRKVDMKEGCQNFNRLEATPHMHAIMARAYAEARHFPADECLRLMTEARKKMEEA